MSHPSLAFCLTLGDPEGLGPELAARLLAQSPPTDQAVLILGPADSPGRRRVAIIVGVAIALVAMNFAWIYPVLTDELLPYSQWLSRMWLRSWI